MKHNILRKTFLYTQGTDTKCLIFWCLGLVSGTLISSVFSQSISVVLQGSSSAHFIWAFLLSVFLPFAVCYLGIRFHREFVLYIVIFMKSFLFYCCFAGICLCYRQGGWLASFLLMFSEGITSPLLVLFIFKNIKGRRSKFQIDAALYIVLCALIYLMDYYLIRPIVLL